MESPGWSRLLARPVAPWRVAHTGAGLLAGSTLEQCAPEGLHPVERTHAGATIWIHIHWHWLSIPKQPKSHRPAPKSGS